MKVLEFSRVVKLCADYIMVFFYVSINGLLDVSINGIKLFYFGGRGGYGPRYIEIVRISRNS